ncbi:MAG: S46 family peptidase [Bacteroidota bacterium]
MIKQTCLPLIVFCLLSPSLSLAGEGMWIPFLLQANEADMQANGMKMSAEDIYSVNQSSLKDAVVLFGGGCTGGILSQEGLLLTNHHCGLSYVQNLSTQEQNYLENGFWAMSKEEELPNPGLGVTFLVRIEDVTDQVLGGLEVGISEELRDAHIRDRSQEIRTKVTEGTSYGARVVPFYYGNEYYLIVTQTYSDVRLVAAPPRAIGKFGGEADNWLWPRHNADFMMFRVYAAADGSPASYSENNVPLKPKHSIPISLKGVQENDFTMIMGYPGTTMEYLPAAGVELVQELRDPVRVNLRAKRLRILEQVMDAEPDMRLTYAKKEAGIANAYKKWRGRVMGLRKNNAVVVKADEEKIFQQKVDANPEWKEKYGDLLLTFDSLYQELAVAQFMVDYFNEGGNIIEVIPFAAKISNTAQIFSESDNPDERMAAIDNAKSQGNRFFRSYRADMDQALMGAVLEGYMEDVPLELQPSIFEVIHNQFGGNAQAFANYAFQVSPLVNQDRFDEWIESFEADSLYKDPIFYMMVSLNQNYYEYLPTYQQYTAAVDSLQRIYMQAQREVFADKQFYPDANLTMRVTYGKVEGMEVRNAVQYNYYTTLGGVIAKHDPKDYEFEVPDRLIELYEAGDFGRYGEDGELHVAFIASNHTSGGNSGSPVVNAEGHLIGLNFDRNWEGTMSDYFYDPNLCRNISVDIRYILFLVDKYGNAGYLLDEMELME